MGDQNVGSQRGGGGGQQAGWSARQSAQRMQARGEEDRLNASRQSGSGGQTQEASSDYTAKRSNKGSSGTGQ
jgi:hypothetical protein